MSLMNNFLRNPKQLKKIARNTNIFQRRRNNRGWTIISLLGLGTALGFAASRNKNIKRPVQNLMNRAQNFTAGRGKGQANFGMAEIAKEFMPDQKSNQANQNQQQNQPNQNQQNNNQNQQTN